MRNRLRGAVCPGKWLYTGIFVGKQDAKVFPTSDARCGLSLTGASAHVAPSGSLL
jgi:hypothetical protein